MRLNVKKVFVLAALCFWQIAAPISRAEVFQSGAAAPSDVVWFDIMVSDLNQAKHFYRQVFGWEFVTQPGGYTVIVAGQKPIGGLDDRHGQPGGGSALYFKVDGVEEYVERARQLGARIVLEPMPVPGQPVVMALFLDPEGNPVGLISGVSQ